MDEGRIAEKKVVFLHVPKTGGSTFRGILKALYGDAFAICQDKTIAEIEATVARSQAIEFHGVTTLTEWFRPHGEIIRQDRWDVLAGADIFTMLRDPVDRYLSTYYYMVQIREHSEAAMAARGLAFPESLADMMERPGSYNFQLEFLLGRPNHIVTPVGRDELEAAKAMLVAQGVHVGVAERFADSVHIFEVLSGQMIASQQIKSMNRTRDREAREEVTPAVRAMIRERSALDQELYEFGTGLLEADVARYGSAPEYLFVEEEMVVPVGAKAGGWKGALGRLLGHRR